MMSSSFTLRSSKSAGQKTLSSVAYELRKYDIEVNSFVSPSEIPSNEKLSYDAESSEPDVYTD